MINIVHMTVNGKAVELAVDPRESLLETLRNRLGLTSVKKGCEVENAAHVLCWWTERPSTAAYI